MGSPVKAYDFLLKFLLVGDSDVGKGEILASLQDGATESPYGYHMGKLLPPGVPPAAVRCLGPLLPGSHPRIYKRPVALQAPGIRTRREAPAAPQEKAVA